MIYRIRRSTQFKRDVKRVLKRGKDLNRLLEIVEKLTGRQPLPAICRDHPLKGEYAGK